VTECPPPEPTNDELNAALLKRLTLEAAEHAAYKSDTSDYDSKVAAHREYEELCAQIRLKAAEPTETSEAEGRAILERIATREQRYAKARNESLKPQTKEF
jgi:hypothetical protein